MFPRELFCPDPGLTAAISPSRLVGAKKFQPQAIFFFLAALSESGEGAAKNLSDLIFRSSALTNIRNWYSPTYIKLVNLFDMKSSQLTQICFIAEVKVSIREKIQKVNSPQFFVAEENNSICDLIQPNKHVLRKCGPDLRF